MPDKAVEPGYQIALKRCGTYLRQTQGFLELTMEGIARLSKMGGLAHALHELDRTLPGDDSDTADLENAERELERVDRVVKMAEAEVAEGFPWLLAHTSVAVWAALETYIQEVVVSALEGSQELRMEAPFLRIRAPVVVYESLSPSERAEFLVREVARGTGADLKRGVGRFETLLEAVQLAGGVDKELSDCLFELSQCRNLVVHRAGVVDRQFADSCPHFRLRSGDRLVISHALVAWYFMGALAYAFIVHNRMAEKDGTQLQRYDGFWPVQRPEERVPRSNSRHHRASQKRKAAESKKKLVG